ncbi:MAG TPA: 3-hydroxyacyl-CoA dehydrogenase NAD-binding domain-containing protein [Solirubrobacterales bacterium]|nr:3-hydroxyacyl-CoA dehydrogenase NAD-binding domain-containing protein [Solirubrobacterales bacterium]
MSVARVGVVGAGTMGSGIAQVAALGGYETFLHDAIPEALETGLVRVGEGLAKGTSRGRWSDEEGIAALERLAGSPSLEGLAGCDLVIEAAPEDVELKRDLFARVAEICGPETILATNTSSLRVADVGAGVPGPERLVGMHFFNPPALMKLVEVVATEASSERALTAVTEVAQAMGRTPIRAKDSPGFVANRLTRPFFLESLRMLAADVADAETIDRVIRLGGGFRMGPFELIDLIGLDVNLEIARSFYAQGGQTERWRPSPIQERLVAEGKLGRKSGEGYYRYGDDVERPLDPELGIPVPTLDPEKLERVDPLASAILRRLFAQIANETAFALEEGVASPEDMDTAMQLGLNWPLGPLSLAEMIGAGEAVQLLGALEREHGAAYAQAPLLRRAAEQGTNLRQAPL